MVVASGQMPYEFDAPLPIRALPNAWPGLGINIATSGDTIEQAMFVYNAEIRKWDKTIDLSSLIQQAYWNPNIASSGFEPKSDGETLAGLVGPPTILSVNNIENMRNTLGNLLFNEYKNDSVYTSNDFKHAWIQTAYPESPSGSKVITFVVVFGFPGFSSTGGTFLRPPAEHISGGNYVDNDIHWLGGSGILFDIDYGEVIFNPFPFPGKSFFFAPSSTSHRFNFGPVTPLIQTTLGTLPTVNANRYNSDLSNGSFKANTNFQAIASGKVQIDGYVLLNGTTIELVKGNDFNVEGTVSLTNDYISHIQGLRQISNNIGTNDSSARCYRTPTSKPSGLYRLLTHNQKSNVPFTAIPSGFVSIWPQGQVVKSDIGTSVTPFIQVNRIDGQQNQKTSDGGLLIDPIGSAGIHVLDDAIWITSNNSFTSSGTFDSAGLSVMSPYVGDFVWYRPAERTVATSGNIGIGPGIFGANVGLFKIGTDITRLSRMATEFITLVIAPNPSTGVYTINWQKYNQTTLDHTEISSSWIFESTGTLPSLNDIRGSLLNGTDIYIWREFNQVIRFTTGLIFDGFFTGDIAARRHSAGGDLLYTIRGSVTTGDPLLSIAGGSSSGIGKWSISSEPSNINTSNGNYTHDSAKPLRAESHFGLETFNAVIHSIFDVTGSTNVTNGIWMIIQFGQIIYLCRIIEETSEWRVVESTKLRDSFTTTAGSATPDEFPLEGILHDID